MTLNCTGWNHVLIYGGDDRTLKLEQTLSRVRVYPGCRRGGSGSRRQAEEAIRRSRPSLVVLLVRWASHPDIDALRATCRAVGVELWVWSRGFSSLCAALTQRGGGRAAR